MFRDSTQRNNVAKTLCGAFGAAHWWTEDGPTNHTKNVVEKRGLNTSAMALFDLAWGMIDYLHPALTTSGYMALDDENRRLVSDLLFAMGRSKSSDLVDEWLVKYSHYRTQTWRSA